MAIRQAERIYPQVIMRRRQWNTAVLTLLGLPLLLFVTMPLLALVLRTGWDALVENVAHSEVWQAVSLTLMTSSIATVLSIVLGLPLAYLLARYTFRGRVVIETLIDLPMVLPPSVAGVALLMAFGRRGVVGAYLSDVGLELAFTQTAVVLAQLFVAAPFFVKAAIAGFAKVEHEIEEAAAIDGAGPLRVFWHITMPLTWPALFGGAVMTWARAMGEFGATIIFAGNFPGRTQTMPLAIYIGFELELGVALTLSLLLLATSFGVLVLVKGLLGQRV